jgi:serine/threonine protein kinase
MEKLSPDTGDSLRPGDVIAEKYRIIRDLGQGAMGSVQLCEHTALSKQFAVKVLHRELADNVGVIERFCREARTAAQLDHPNSVRVTDFGQDARGTLYLAMEYTPGHDLADVIAAEWPLSDERIVHIMTSVLSALSAAHGLGIVHRDLKPENILVNQPSDASSEEVIKVCDFGIAQMSQPHVPSGTASARRITGDGLIVGTCAYMSPEQSRGAELDARSDLYSAGVVLFQLLTGNLPFTGDNPLAVAVAHCTTPPPPPSGYTAVHPVLEAVCLKALSKTPEARYQSATEMLHALKAALAKPTPTRKLGRVSRTSLTPPPPAGRHSLARLSPNSVAPTEVTPLKAAERLGKRRSVLLIAAVSLIILAIAAAPALWSRSGPLETLLRRAATVFTSSASATELEPGEHLVAPATAPAQSDALESVAEFQPQAALTATHAAAHDSSAALPPLAAQRRPAPRPRKVATAKPSAAASPDASVPAVLTGASEPVVGDVPAPLEPAPAEPVEAHELAEGESRVAAADTERSQPLATVLTSPIAHQAPADTRLSIQLDKIKGGASKMSVRNAVNHEAVARCYKPGSWSGSGALEITTDMTGRIVAAEAHGADMPKVLRECIEQIAKSGQIREADVGAVHASFALATEP